MVQNSCKNMLIAISCFLFSAFVFGLHMKNICLLTHKQLRKTKVKLVILHDHSFKDYFLSRWTSINRGLQQDIHEFMQTLFSSLEKELSREKFMVLSSLFNGKTKVGYKYSVGIL